MLSFFGVDSLPLRVIAQTHNIHAFAYTLLCVNTGVWFQEGFEKFWFLSQPQYSLMSRMNKR